MAQTPASAGLLWLLRKVFGVKVLSKHIGLDKKVVKGFLGKNNPFTNDWSAKHLKDNPDLLTQAKETMEKGISHALSNPNVKQTAQFRNNLQKIYDIENPPSAKVLDISSKKQVTGEGLASLEKEAGLPKGVEPGSPIANVQQSGRELKKSLDEMEKMAKEMSPEAQVAKEAKRKEFLKRRYEGEGFKGFNQEGYHRAVVRPFLIDQHDKGIIKLSDEAYKSIKEGGDLSSGGFNDFAFPDPVRVFRQHYGDDAFKRISPDIQSPARSDILESMAEANFKPVMKEGPKRPGGYLTKGEYRAKIEEAEHTVDLYKTSDEGWIGALSKDDRAKTVAEANLGLEEVKMNFKMDFPDEVLPADNTLWGFDPEDLSHGGIVGPLHLYEGGRVGYKKGTPATFLIKKGIDLVAKYGPEFKKFVHRLFMKESNEMRLGKGKWKGLDDKQRTTQHDNLVKKLNTFDKEGTLTDMDQYFGIDAEKAFQGAKTKVTGKVSSQNQYLEELDNSIMETMELTKSEMDNMSSTALDDLRRNADPIGMEQNLGEITPGRGVGDFADDPSFLRDESPVIQKQTAKVKTTKVSDDVMEKAYDEVSHQLNKGDIKYEADVLAESIAEQQGKVYADLADAERSELYGQAYKRMSKDLKMRMDLKKEFPTLERMSKLSPKDELRLEIKKRVADVMKDTSDAGLKKSIETDNLKLEFPGISDEMIENILTDMNPQRIAEVKQTMREALKMQEKMSPEDIINTFKKTPRTIQASGGRVSMVKGGLAGVLGV